MSHLNSSVSYKYSQNTSYTNNPGLNQETQITSPKAPSSYLNSSSPYIIQRKPGLFKSSKYITTKTEEPMK